MRMRGLNEAFDEIRRSDPGTALTKTALRRLVTTGQIPSVRVGVKYLVSVEAVERYLEYGTVAADAKTTPPPLGVIRRVDQGARL